MAYAYLSYSGTEQIFLLLDLCETSEKQAASNRLPATQCQHINRLGGAVFGSHASAVARFGELYYRTMESMRLNGLFVGNDQDVMAAVTVLHLGRFMLLQPRPDFYGANLWPFSDYFWSDGNVPESGTPGTGREREPGWSSEPRSLCMIFHKAGDDDQAEAILATWVKRRDGHVLIGTGERRRLRTIVVNQRESRRTLWAKAQAMLRYANSQRDSYDWFLKADDDTYVVMENLRHFLSNRSTLEPVYIGAEFKRIFYFQPRTGFLSGGAGYVFSRKAVQLLVEEGFDRQVCNLRDSGLEEVRLEECAIQVGVHHDGRTLDQQGRGRFFPSTPERHFTPGNEDLNGTLRYDVGRGAGCCSDSAISFHNITPTNMYVLEYLTYVLRPCGV